MNIKIFKKKGSNLKGFQDENGNILEDAFATEFNNNGYTYYKHYTYGGTTDYYMGYCNVEKGVKITEPFARRIDGVFVYDRSGKIYEKNNRFIKIYNPHNGECLDNDFAEIIYPSIFDTNVGITPLVNRALLDHRISKDISSSLLLRFKKDNQIGLVNQEGVVVVPPFANSIDVDGLFETNESIGMINLFTGQIEFELEYIDYNIIGIYKPDIEKGNKTYVINLNNEYNDLTSIIPSIKSYLNNIIEVYKYKHF